MYHGIQGWWCPPPTSLQVTFICTAWEVANRVTPHHISLCPVNNQNEYDYTMLHKVRAPFSLAMTDLQRYNPLSCASPSALVKCISRPKDFILTHEQFQIIVQLVSWARDLMPAATCNCDRSVDLRWGQSWAGNCFRWMDGPIVRNHHRVLSGQCLGTDVGLLSYLCFTLKSHPLHKPTHRSIYLCIMFGLLVASWCFSVPQPSVEESPPQATNHTLGIRRSHMIRPTRAVSTDMLSI